MIEGPPIDINRKLSPGEILEIVSLLSEATEPEEFHPVKNDNNPKGNAETEEQK
jgi:hypothetical protein